MTAKSAAKVLPHKCGRCPARWSGANTCHCSAPACHLTFTSPSGFDDHRVRGLCLTAAQLARRGYVELREGVLGVPQRENVPHFRAAQTAKGSVA